MNIYVYVEDAVGLRADVGMALEDKLTMPSLDIPGAQAKATTVYKPYDIMPNYTLFGADHTDPAFQFATGVYYVGASKGDAPAWPVGDGQKEKIGDIVSAFRKAHAGLTDVFWLCCRSAPDNANNFTGVVNVGVNGGIMGPASMGLKPSQVKAQGGWR
jgi:hypothetical protein